jgi:hypothetical protein
MRAKLPPQEEYAALGGYAVVYREMGRRRYLSTRGPSGRMVKCAGLGLSGWPEILGGYGNLPFEPDTDATLEGAGGTRVPIGCRTKRVTGVF